MFQQVSLPDFDYAGFGLEDIQEEADGAAVRLAINLNNLGTLTAKIILEDGPRLMEVRDRLIAKRCWVKWLETKYPKCWRTAYNCLEICSMMQILQRDHPELVGAVEQHFLNASQRALLALGSTGDNFRGAVEVLFQAKVPPTGEQVKEFQPAKPSEREAILRHVKTWGKKNKLSAEKIVELQSEACDRAKNIAKENRRQSPTVSDFSQAVSETIGKDLPPTPKRTGSKALEGITAEGYWDLVAQNQQQRKTIAELKDAIAELENRYAALAAEHEALLSRTSVAA